MSPLRSMFQGNKFLSHSQGLCGQHITAKRRHGGTAVDALPHRPVAGHGGQRVTHEALGPISTKVGSVLAAKVEQGVDQTYGSLPVAGRKGCGDRQWRHLNKQVFLNTGLRQRCFKKILLRSSMLF